MIKHLLLVLALALGLGIPALGARVQISNQALKVDGRSVSCEAYNIDDENYFKLRDMAMLLNGTAAQFSVGYDEAARAVKIVTGEAYVPVGGELEKGKDMVLLTPPFFSSSFRILLPQSLPLNRPWNNPPSRSREDKP